MTKEGVTEDTQNWANSMKPRENNTAPEFGKDDVDDFTQEMKVVRREIVKNKMIAGMDLGKGTEDIHKQIQESVQRELAPVKEFINKLDKKEEMAAVYQNMVSPLKEQIKSIESVISNKQLSASDQLSQATDLLINVADFFKKNIGLPGTTQAGSQDLGLMVQLEEKKLDREDRQRQHDKEMKILDQRHEEEVADRKRRWEIEDRHWEEEFKQRAAEFDQGKNTRERALGGLEDLIGSLAQSVEVERHAVEKQPPSGEVTKVKMIKAFPCEDCGQVIEVGRDHRVEEPVTCPKCGAVYDLAEMMVNQQPS